jgi:hypothetical protein
VIGQLRALRFWGVAPPDPPHGTILTDDQRELAKSLTRWPTTPPVGIMG